jgi:flagellar hook-associated protein 2
MALITNVGLGSGLDISNLVKQLVDAERAAPSAALNRREARTKAQISAIGQLNSAFSTLKTAVDKLKAGTPFEARRVESRDTERLAASIRAGQTPALGSYQMEIESLASAQKLQSDPLAVPAADTVLGTGTLRFAVNGSQFDVVVSDSNNDIYALASSINTAAAGKVQAAVVRGDTGFRLSLTSGSLGEAGEITVTQTAGGASLAAFTSAELDETTAATDAVFFIDGTRRTASSNVISDAINGLELNLKKAEVGQSFQLVVSEDRSGAQKAVQDFVNAYNGAIGALKTVSAYNPEQNTAAALNGDAFVRSASAQLRSFIGDAFRAAASEGVELGIDTQVDGSLVLDAAKFNAALAADPDAVKALYSGEGGVVPNRFAGYLETLLGEEGTLVLRKEGLDGQLKVVTRDREALDRRMLAFEERYRKQFVALDGLLGRLNNTSQYLSQQLAGLAANSGG